MPHGDITHIELPVNDFKRASAFYTSLFGWDLATPPGFEDYPMWRAPNQISGGGLVRRGESNEQPRSYVEVNSIDDALAAVEAGGGTVVMARTPISETSWWAAFTDPDGNTLGLYEYGGEPDS